MYQTHLKIAWRNLRRHRTYTGLNILGLSVGLAGTLLIVMFLRHHLSVDRHHSHFTKIFRVHTDVHLPDGSVEYNPEAPLPMAEVLRREFSQVDKAAFLIQNRELTVSTRPKDRAEPVRIKERKGTGLVEPDWFSIWEYTWLQGTAATALKEPNRAILTQSWARKYFGDANPLGQTLTLNNQTDVTVTGVVADPAGPTSLDLGLFISMGTLKSLYRQYDPSDWYFLNSTNRLYITLRDPKSASALQQALPALSKRHYGADASTFRFSVQPLRQVHFDTERGSGGIRPALLWALGAVGALLLLAACINFINLATVQALQRSKEIGIRKTLGSSRGQLIRLFLLETTLITGASLVVALVLVLLVLPFFNQWVQLPLAFRPDVTTLAFITLLPGCVILVAGGYPALVLSRSSPQTALRGNLSAPAATRFTLRQTLVVTQLVVCQALLIGSLVVAHQVRYFHQADLGFRKENVLVVTLPEAQKSRQDALKQRLLQQAGIHSISLCHRPPSSEQLFGGSFKFNGKADWEPYPIRDRLADADYLRTYGLQLLAGRNLLPSDTIREYLINETLLHKLGFQEPSQVLGKRLQYHLSQVPLPIVGVVKDFHQKSLREEIGPCIIASEAGWYARAGIWISGNDPDHTLQRIRQTWQQLYPEEVFDYEFLDEQVARFYETETLTARLIYTVTGLAVLICCLGLYGMVSHVVVHRTKEIGIRKVLGARIAGIVALLTKEFVLMTVVALVLASPLAWYVMSQWLRGFAYRVGFDAWIFLLSGVIALGIVLLTVGFQSIRAARMDPVKSLKME
jgi:putative ABC transport system permease protein